MEQEEKLTHTQERDKTKLTHTQETKTISKDVCVCVCVCVQGSCKGIENGNQIFYRFAWTTPPETDSSNVK